MNSLAYKEVDCMARSMKKDTHKINFSITCKGKDGTSADWYQCRTILLTRIIKHDFKLTYTCT